MTELMRLIQAHQDRYGVSRAEVARRAGTNPQTVHNWRDEIKKLPYADNLRGIANVIGVPYAAVLDAALVDTGYRESMADAAPDIEDRIKRAVKADPSLLEDLWLLINRLRAEHSSATAQAVVAPEDVEARAAADLIARILRRDAGGRNLPLAARTEDYPKED